MVKIRWKRTYKDLRSRKYEMQMQNPSTENRRPGRCVVGWGVKRRDQCFCHAGEGAGGVCKVQVLLQRRDESHATGPTINRTARELGLVQ